MGAVMELHDSGRHHWLEGIEVETKVRQHIRGRGKSIHARFRTHVPGPTNLFTAVGDVRESRERIEARIGGSVSSSSMRSGSEGSRQAGIAGPSMRGPGFVAASSEAQ